MKSITVIMTCFNRKEYTLRCVKSLHATSGYLPDWKFRYVIVDDGSTDGTKEAVLEYANANALQVDVVDGNGKLFYTGGMRMGISYAKEHFSQTGHFMLINDDVRFDEKALADMIEDSKNKDYVIVGATKDDDGKYSYGGVKYVKGIHYRAVTPEDSNLSCDTFNANCVLIPENIFRNIPNMDEGYNHSLGDFDYGLQIKRKGYEIFVHNQYIGICNKNSVKGTWNDISLKRLERLKKKESLKGLPRKEWFHFLKKNFGIWTALTRSVTPYVRIILGK